MSNSASRILDILKQAERYRPDTKTMEVWAAVFDVEEADKLKQSREISRCLDLLSDEIDIVKSEMGLGDKDEFQCLPLFDSLNQILNINILNNPWETLKRTLTREVFLCLGYCREVLPDSEEIVDEAELESMLGLLKALEEQLADSSLPRNVKLIIRSNIDKIYQAIHSYKICGTSALREVMTSTLGDFVVHKEEFESVKGDAEVDKYGQIVTGMADMVDKATKTEKAITTGMKLLGHASKAVEFLGMPL